MVDEVKVVHTTTEVASKQGLGYFIGISEATAGAKGISMNMVAIPPVGTAQPHRHQGFETAIYILKGQVNFRYGAGLRQSAMAGEGDFIFIGPGVPHQPVNMSATEPAYVIVARNDPNEQESVVPYDPDSSE